MGQDPRYTAIQKCFDTALTLLASGTVDLTSFGQELVSAGFLDQAALNNILDTPGHTTNYKTSKLLQCVSAQVKINPEQFYEAYLGILERRPALISLLEGIRKEYGNQVVQSPAIPEPTCGSKAGSSTYTESLPVEQSVKSRKTALVKEQENELKIVKGNSLREKAWKRASVEKRRLEISKEQMTILLMGSSGHGKSALGNFLLDPSEKHITGDPTFPIAGSIAPKTKEVTVASKDGLIVIDTPGLNKGDFEDLKLMIAIVKKLNELQSISACILCVKFESKIDSQCKATVDYYKRLLPQLFENNVFVVFTNYCTDERSQFNRMRLRIDERAIVESHLDEVSTGLVYKPAYFHIDALPFSEEERSQHEAIRSGILEYTRILMPVYIHKSLKVPKTPAVLAEDKKEIEKIIGQVASVYERSARIEKLEEDSMTVEEAEKMLKKMYL